MTRAEYRRAERQAKADRAFLESFPKPRPAEPGRVNIWACPKCGLPTVAVDLHAGTTPYILVCRARLADFDALGDPVSEDHDQLCGGAARSVMYLLPDPETTPDWVARLLADPPWEWYLPTDLAELRALGPEMAEHVRKGGLCLRRREGHGFDPADELADQSEPERSRWQRFWEGLSGR